MRLAVDLGGSWLRWEVVGGENGKVPSQNIDILEYLKELIKDYKIKKIAISVAGQVEKNRLLSAPNLSNIDFKELEIPYIIENDLKCAVIAEGRYYNSNSICTLFSGTGLGSGVLDREVIRGWRNFAGEIGHIPYQKAPFYCGCGKDNCLELYASGSAIKKWAEYLGVTPSLKEPQIYQKYTKALLYASATLLSLFNPKFLILGGGVIEANPSLIELLKVKLPLYAPPFALEGVVIEKSYLKNPSLEGAKILLERF